VSPLNRKSKIGIVQREKAMKPPMKSKLCGLVAITALMASVALAHGDKKHVVGTLEKINVDSVVVKTAAGKSVEVKLVATTMYVSHAGNEDKPAKLADLTVGDRVVIHATPKGETLEANEIKFSASSSASAAAAATSKR
jgi:hypothetical protein